MAGKWTSLSVWPFDHRCEADVIAENFIGGLPAFEILERCRRKKLNDRAGARMLGAEIDDRKMLETRDQSEGRWNGDFDGGSTRQVQLYDVFRALDAF